MLNSTNEARGARGTRGARGSVVFKALCYKLDRRGLGIQSGNSVLKICLILLAALDPEVYLASNIIEYRRENIF
jgi:hypothetical protein